MDAVIPLPRLRVPRRHPLSRAEQRELEDRRRQLKQEAMTPAEIGRLMRKVAHEALDRNGAVEMADFIRANVPEHAVKTRARAIIMEVVDERKNGGITA